MTFQRALFLFAMVFLASVPAWSMGYRENVESGSDIVMMDFRWPWWPSATYYASWNVRFNSEKPNSLYCYAGIQMRVPDGPDSMPNPDLALHDAFRPSNTWSFWGTSADGVPPRFVDVGPTLSFVNGYGGEGTTAYQTGMPWSFIKCHRWYTMLGRVWQPVEGGEQAYFGRWIKDNHNGRWYLGGVVWLPVEATSVTGNHGFIEQLTSPKMVRPLHRRLGYARKDGQWKKADTITPSKTAFQIIEVLPEDNYEYVAIEYAQRTDLMPIKLKGEVLDSTKSHSFKVKQPDVPVFDKPSVTNAKALTTGGQVAVSWEIPDTSSPAFAYKIEVFDNPQCRGKAIAVKEERMPTVRHALVDAKVKSPTVRLTVTDVYDQAAAPVVFSAVKTKASPAKHIRKTVPGMNYELLHKYSKRQENFWYDPYYKKDEKHYWLTLDEIDKGKLHRRGRAQGFDMSIQEHKTEGYAMKFDGLLRVPADGLYILRAQIDGAYRFCIDGKEVLLRDGQYGANVNSVILTLSKGDHPLSVTYLYDKFQGLRMSNFVVKWEGPNMPLQEIPLESLRVVDDGKCPQVALRGRSIGDGTGEIKVTVKANGRKINKTVLYLGDLQLAENDGAGLEVQSPLPEGSNKLWSRVIFDGNYTVDSKAIELNVSGKPLDERWTTNNLGDSKASAGIWQAGPKSFQFFGNGMHSVTRKIKGDFTATCRIDGYNGSNGEPVNPGAWVGLSSMKTGQQLTGRWIWGSDFFYIVQSAGRGLRTAADFTDAASTRFSSYRLPKGRPWLRIVRQGDIWTAWTSTDGKDWEMGAYQYRKTVPQVDVGLFFRALPQDALAHYHASVSNLTIEPGVLDESSIPSPPTARNTEGPRLTGVVMAHSDPDVVVVRSTSIGLLRSADGGKTWASANGNLSGDDLSVRSVAIHPTNPLVMLRACGRGANGSLYKTTDGGKTWTKLDFEGDFDGNGPSALCGEVVEFDLRAPDKIYVGCESKGFFKSPNSGRTWSHLGLSGERITSVNVWPWERFYPAPAQGKTQLCVTSCPDRWMRFLGRGEPSVSTTATSSCGYSARNDVQFLAVSDERTDTGYYNATYDKATQVITGICYATTRGLDTQVFAPTQMALLASRKNIEWLRPMTAIATTSKGDQKFGRFIIQGLDPEVPGRLSISERWGFAWSWLEPKGQVSDGGLISVYGDHWLGDKWWFVYTDGLYYSPDGGRNMKKILDKSGVQCAP